LFSLSDYLEISAISRESDFQLRIHQKPLVGRTQPGLVGELTALPRFIDRIWKAAEKGGKRVGEGRKGGQRTETGDKKGRGENRREGGRSGKGTKEEKRTNPQFTSTNLNYWIHL